jgi:ATP-dependent Clp protease ATP-binding subunit ClpA
VGFRGAGDTAPLPAHEHEKPLRKTLEQRLRPELVSRVQAVIDFRKLDGSAAMAIAEKFLREMEERLAIHGRDVEVSAEVRAKILREAGSSRYGARDIHRLVESEIAKLVDSV